ncbi:hypothetical protein FAIPA1_360006 [Frankia sp. AiPs1]
MPALRTSTRPTSRTACPRRLPADTAQDVSTTSTPLTPAARGPSPPAPAPAPRGALRCGPAPRAVPWGAGRRIGLSPLSLTILSLNVVSRPRPPREDAGAVGQPVRGWDRDWHARGGPPGTDREAPVTSAGLSSVGHEGSPVRYLDDSSRHRVAIPQSDSAGRIPPDLRAKDLHRSVRGPGRIPGRLGR